MLLLRFRLSLLYLLVTSFKLSAIPRYRIGSSKSPVEMESLGPFFGLSFLVFGGGWLWTRNPLTSYVRSPMDCDADSVYEGVLRWIAWPLPFCSFAFESTLQLIEDIELGFGLRVMHGFKLIIVLSSQIMIFNRFLPISHPARFLWIPFSHTQLYTKSKTNSLSRRPCQAFPVRNMHSETLVLSLLPISIRVKYFTTWLAMHYKWL